ncbi:hypothetical protein WJX81_001962 [Elliptochloris bilobata]|uniref:Glycosyltransferase 2-like domain-containing protein n=1 Tax=Elliptochloris bilobata TaxID=381761 RepID=A0AAW1RBG0_9CHLO
MANWMEIARTAVACEQPGNLKLIRRPPPLSRRGRALLLASGCLDVFAYCSQCLGFALCGVALAAAVLPAASQTMTAVLSRVLLGRRLSRQQLLAVVIVNGGLLLRAAAPQPLSAEHNASPKPQLLGMGAWQLAGCCALAASAVGHSLLGVLYELLLRERPPPAYADYMQRTSRIGLAVASMYQVGYTLPRWGQLISTPLNASKVSPAAAAAALAGFGIAYNVHAWVQARVFAREGVVAVGLANAVRGGVVSLVADGGALPQQSVVTAPDTAPTLQPDLPGLPVRPASPSAHTSFASGAPDAAQPMERMTTHGRGAGTMRWVVFIAVLLVCAVLGYGIADGCMHGMSTGSWDRCAARAATAPVISVLALFSVIALVSCVVITLGPIAHVESNSRCYSAVPPQKWIGPLPRVTIQMPVYKEGLAATIGPSVESLLAALAAYHAAGGEGLIFVNDDGMQLLDKAERAERIAYYTKHNIAYVARPPHGRDGYVRAGRFKKASNMNFCLTISQRVSKLMQESGLGPEEALAAVKAATAVARSTHAFLAGGDVRMGDFVLLVDSDTRVPEDCILPVVTELLRSPHVAFTQHYTTPLQARQ